MTIILASHSPRRAELLKKIVPEFTIIPSDVDESAVRENDPVRFAITAAVAKAKDVGERNPSALVIGADTVVALGTDMLGKPADRAEAEAMLRRLSGTRHRVITGVALYCRESGDLITDREITAITFNELDDRMIADYLDGGEFLDKAGAYAIQQVGDTFVKKTDGDFDNVVGFPTSRVRKMLDRLLGETITGEVCDIALPNDWGVVKHENYIYFVPGALPGDTVRIRKIKGSKTFGYGELRTVEKPSPFRIKPECPHFGVCGGCILQNLAYEEQVNLKKTYLLSTFRKIGGLVPDEIPLETVLPSPDRYFYRNKMEFAFGEQGGKVVLGLRERASPLHPPSSEIVPLTVCPIFSATVEKLFPVFLEFAAAKKLSAFHAFSRKGFLRHLVLREGKKTGELMVMLVTGGGDADVTPLAERLLAAVPNIKSLFWVQNDQPADVVNYQKRHHLYGETHITDTVGRFTFTIHPQTFFQPNTRGAELLYGKVLEFAQAGAHEKIIGLYSGTGPIEIFLSQSAGSVTGIDIAPANIAAAQENCRRNNIGNCRFRCGTVEKEAQNFSGGADLVVIDPPRAGISGKAMRNIFDFNAPRVVYVSCNPATLARDVKTFREHGYTLKRLAGVDLFPHTGHMETVALLER